MRAGILVAAGLMLVGCGQAEGVHEEPKEAQHLPVSMLEVKSGQDMQQLKVEVADDDREREVGLMFRHSMADDAGMVFVWPQPQELSFWMRNTYIPLDIIYVRHGKIVRVIPWAKPMDETALPSGEPADTVLEVNGGWAAKHNVGVGDAVSLK